MYVILVYDISIENKGEKRWRHVFKICKKYLHHVQNSVFEGELTSAQRVSLRMEVNREIKPDEDSVIIFETRQERWLKKEILGVQEDKTSCFL